MCFTYEVAVPTTTPAFAMQHAWDYGNGWQQGRGTSRRWGSAAGARARGWPRTGKGKGYGKQVDSGQQVSQPISPQAAVVGNDGSDITKQVAKLTAYIDNLARFEDTDPDMVELAEKWRSKRRELQAQRNNAKPRDQRLRELASDVSAAKKELAKKKESLEAARDSMEAAKVAHEDLGKLVQRKEAKLAEMEEEQKQLQEAIPANEPKKDTKDNQGITKEMLADILAATGGTEAAQGERLDPSWAKWQEAQEAKRKQERDNKEREEAQRTQAQEGAGDRMQVDSKVELEELQGSLDGMLDGVELSADVRTALEKRRTEIVAAARAKRQRNL